MTDQVVFDFNVDGEATNGIKNNTIDTKTHGSTVIYVPDWREHDNT